MSKYFSGQPIFRAVNSIKNFYMQLGHITSSEQTELQNTMFDQTIYIIYANPINADIILIGHLSFIFLFVSHILFIC